MSRGDLQEMEVGTKQSKGPVNANAKPGDPMPKLTTGGTAPSYEDLGGPSPDNYKPDNDSAKIKEPKIKTLTPTTNHPDCQPYCSITSETGIGITIPPNDKPIVEIAIALLRFVINHLETVLSETVCPKQIKPTLINNE